MSVSGEVVASCISTKPNDPQDKPAGFGVRGVLPDALAPSLTIRRASLRDSVSGKVVLPAALARNLTIRRTSLRDSLCGEVG